MMMMMMMMMIMMMVAMMMMMMVVVVAMMMMMMMMMVMMMMVKVVMMMMMNDDLLNNLLLGFVMTYSYLLKYDQPMFKIIENNYGFFTHPKVERNQHLQIQQYIQTTLQCIMYEQFAKHSCQL